MKTAYGSWLKAGGLILIGMVIGWAVPGPQPTVAGDRKRAEPPRIGYVNIAKVLRDYDRANAEGKKITERRQGYVEKVKAERQTLAEATEKYQATDDPQARLALQQQALAIQKRIEDLDKEAQKELTDQSNKTIVEVYEQIRTVFADVAKDHGLDVVEAFPAVSKAEDEKSPQVAQLMLQTPALMPFYLNPAFDYTAEVIERLNKKYPPDKDD